MKIDFIAEESKVIFQIYIKVFCGVTVISSSLGQIHAHTLKHQFI